MILGDIRNVFVALHNVKGNEGDLQVTGDTGTLAKGLADILNKHLKVENFSPAVRPEIERIKKACEGKTVETGGTPGGKHGKGTGGKPSWEAWKIALLATSILIVIIVVIVIIYFFTKRK